VNCLYEQGLRVRALHECHADGDHAMCNISNHTILVVQLRQFKKLSSKDHSGTVILISLW
jgi:hypothetical protein